MEYYRADARHILRKNKHEEKQIKLKRRWLLGLPLTESERKEFNKILKFWPESSLRKDDIFYESVRTNAEGTFGAHCIERENCIPQDDMDLNQIPNLKRLILSCLDNLTTTGLYLFALLVSGDKVKSERNRTNLKKIIKKSLSSVLSSNSHNHCQLETRKQLFQFLTNPQHFRDSRQLWPALRSQFYHAAVEKVLCRLQNLPSQTLIAMHRKLKGVKAPMLQLQPRKHGWARDHLIKQVNKISREMLLQLDGGNELQEPLAKAMAVANLSLRLTAGFRKVFSEEFYQFSPEVKFLQSDIMNAIWFVKKVTTVPVLRDLQLLIEPKAAISNRGLRGAFVNLLTEFLFECSDMDSAPKSLLQILDVINKGSNSKTHNVSFQEKDIEKEVECILSVSAQTEQIILDLLPDNEFDWDFTDTCMEPLEDTDDDDNDEDDSQLQEDRQFISGAFSSIDSNYEGESIGDFTPFESPPCTNMIAENILSCPYASRERVNSDSEKLQPKNSDAVNLESKIHNTPFNNQYQGENTSQTGTFMAGKNYNSSVVSPDKKSSENVVKRCDFYGSDVGIDPRDATNFCEETEPMPTKYSAGKNQYLAIQEACDKTSMLAYNLIGHMMEGFAITEGLDLDLSKSLSLGGDNHIEEVKETKEQSSSGKHTRCSAIVRVIEELIPSFPNSSMERLQMLMGL